MKHDKIQLQAGLFGDFTNIKPTAQTIKHFMESFSELSLIPSVLEMPDTKPQMGVTFQLGPPIRFLFRSEDNLWTISFQNERVDVLAKKDSPESAELPDVAAFIAQAIAIFRSVNSREEVGYSRLSYITRHFLLDSSEEDLNNLFAKRFGPTTFYSKNPPRDWQFRISARATLESISQEQTNVITQLARKRIAVAGDSEPTLIDGIECTFDINTAEENQESRFSIDNYLDFLNEVAVLENALQEEMLIADS